MIFKTIFLVLTAFIILMTTIVWSQDLMIYPAQGQSNEQMEKDKFECYNWAKGQTGFDPMQMPTASSPPPSQEKKSVGGSALKGGAVGAVGIGLDLRALVFEIGVANTGLTTPLVPQAGHQFGIIGRVPLGRMGTAAEAANAAVFLASDESSYLVGTEIAVDGGMLP